jgi:hypothetical protein
MTWINPHISLLGFQNLHCVRRNIVKWSCNDRPCFLEIFTGYNVNGTLCSVVPNPGRFRKCIVWECKLYWIGSNQDKVFVKIFRWCPSVIMTHCSSHSSNVISTDLSSLCKNNGSTATIWFAFPTSTIKIVKGIVFHRKEFVWSHLHSVRFSRNWSLLRCLFPQYFSWNLKVDPEIDMAVDHQIRTI